MARSHRHSQRHKNRETNCRGLLATIPRSVARGGPFLLLRVRRAEDAGMFVCLFVGWFVCLSVSVSLSDEPSHDSRTANTSKQATITWPLVAQQSATFFRSSSEPRQELACPGLSSAPSWLSQKLFTPPASDMYYRAVIGFAAASRSRHRAPAPSSLHVNLLGAFTSLPAATSTCHEYIDLHLRRKA